VSVFLNFELKADLGPLLGWAAGNPKREALLRQQVTQLATDQTLKLWREVVLRTPVNTGKLSQSITHTSQAEIAMMAAAGHVRAAVYSAPPVGGVKGYALPVETGTRPHVPPLEPLLLWAAQRARDKGKGIKDVTGFAQAVRWHIARHGTVGAKMFEQAWAGEAAGMLAAWEALVDKLADAWVASGNKAG